MLDRGFPILIFRDDKRSQMLEAVAAAAALL